MRLSSENLVDRTPVQNITNQEGYALASFPPLKWPTSEVERAE